MSGLPEFIAKNLIKLRTERGWTQKETAQLIGVSPTSYCIWEKGQTHIKFENLDKIAKLYHINILDLFK